MATILTILGLINGVQQMRSGDKLGGIASALGTAYNAGWFNSTSPSYQYHSFGETDAGARRNYL